MSVKTNNKNAERKYVMKRVLTGLMAVIMLLTVTVCGNTDNKVNEADRYTTMIDNSNSTNNSTTANIDKIKIVTPDGNIIIKLEDNKAADGFLNIKINGYLKGVTKCITIL